MACNWCSNPCCNGGSLCNYNITNGLLCTDAIKTCITQEAKTCGCKYLQPSDCVYYSGSITPCLAIKTNTSLTDIIKKFDATFCTFTPSGTPSGCPITVTGTSGQITVSQTGSGCSSNYQIGLSSTITNNLTTINSQINDISIFLDTAVNCITTNTPETLSISGPVSGCMNIDFIPPSSGISGILYSDYTDSTTVNNSWTTLKTYSITATTLSTNGDKLIANTRFLSTPNQTIPPKVRIQFNGITIVKEWDFNISNLDILDFELWIVRISNTSVSIILKVLGGSDNSTYYQTFGPQARSYVISIAGLNLSTTSYSINCDANSSIAGDTGVKFLEVEYIKKI